MNSLTINRVAPVLWGLTLSLTTVFTNSASAKEYLVNSQLDYREVLTQLAPGDTIILKDGIWNDFEIIFEGEGEPDLPITLRAETPGQVHITGQSSLALAGEYLLVSGLVCRDG